MIFDPETLDATACYKLLIGSIVPRAIGWASTLSSAGISNLAPFSFFTVVSRKPPMVSLTIQPRSDRKHRAASDRLGLDLVAGGRCQPGPILVFHCRVA